MSTLTKALSIILLTLAPLAASAITASTYLTVPITARIKLLANTIKSAYKEGMLEDFCPPQQLNLPDLLNRIDYTIRAVPELKKLDIIYVIPMVLESHYPCRSI